MIKKVLHAIWTFSLQKGWNWIWSKTTIDEKAISVTNEVKARTKAVTVELEDVKKTLKEVGTQLEDVGNSLKGEKRKGRKPKI
jgi:hypothetical protein